jgi:hypothetical protein
MEPVVYVLGTDDLARTSLALAVQVKGLDDWLYAKVLGAQYLT